MSSIAKNLPLPRRLVALWRERRVESRILMLAFAILVFGFMFAKVASEIMEGEAAAIDKAIILALRDPNDLSHPIGPAWLERAMVDVTALGGFTVLWLVTLFAAGYLLAVRQRILAAFTVASVAIGALLNTGLKELYARSRPDLVEHLVGTSTTSFPSGHAMNSATVFLTLAVLVARTQTSRSARVYLLCAAMALTGIVGFSRIYLGVHWPTDVLAGWCVGSAWAIVCSLAIHLLSGRR